MSNSNVLAFLRAVGGRRDLLDRLKVQSKAEVIAAAGELGYPFTEAEFDPLIWGLELRLAEKIGQAFDQRFQLWQTMWGQYYLEYLALDLMPSLDALGLGAA
jgi:hypothetical protein